MTQAANCGSTPAALQNMSVMSTLTGTCNVNRAVTSGDTSGTVGTGRAASSSGTASTASTAGVTSSSTAAASPTKTGSASSAALRSVAVPQALVGGMSLLASAWWLLG
ncbi:hypothetical protein BR93DRAFT_931739 [Coniochaeta sp. PMI_546]|nr:hypothetical protein BR93DRAFT_931739 [Coniochaeta sp. PMI_546]